MAQLSSEIDGAAPADAIARVLDRSGYTRALEKQGPPEAEARMENLRELLAAADDFAREGGEALAGERSALELFLDQVALVSDLDSYDRRDETVSLMTVHSAKGLEFPVVFLSGMEEGIFPHSAALRDGRGIEEERRLCYVGMTRAMEMLTLTCAAERFRFGSRSHSVPSRFLREIPPEVIDGDTHTPAGGDSSLDYSYSQGDAPDVAPGLRVRHPVFGPGVVLSVAGNEPNQKLKIRFERAGVKTVLVRYANLELG